MSVGEEPLTGLSDLELLRRTAAGDSRAFAQFAGRHQSAIYRHLFYLAARREDAEDLLQETFLSALRAAGQFRGDSSARTWLFRIAWNAALRRRSSPVPEIPGTAVESLEALAFRAGWGRENPESLAMLAQDRERLGAALSLLKAEEREALLLRDVEGLSGEQTAGALGISLAALKSRLHRGRIALAALLRDHRRREA